MNQMNKIFRWGSISYPQPVALACGRICRARNSHEHLDAIIKAAEVLTRYLAIIGISSFSAREDKSIHPPGAFKEFEENLSFGNFLSVIQELSSSKAQHPLASKFAYKFSDKGKKAGTANLALTSLLNLRNDLGHDLMSLSEAKIVGIFKKHQPSENLINAFKALEGLLILPLFLIEEQRYSHNMFYAPRLVLMGESEPIPGEIELINGLNETCVPYLGVTGGVLRLDPLLLWKISENRNCSCLYIIHATKTKTIKLVSIENDELEINSIYLEKISLLRSGNLETYEPIKLASGIDVITDWIKEKKQLEFILSAAPNVVPWDKLDKDTLFWYKNRISHEDDQDYKDVITRLLLDGRDTLSSIEIKQIVLLFGKKDEVKTLLHRLMMDCRMTSSAKKDTRWDKRVESTSNIIQSLHKAIDFFGRHIGVDGVTLDGLTATSGSADYIAMREGLVNLFIHQDYLDESAAAQIDITPNQAIFFNPGKSLVGMNTLIEGGKSQSRNPIVARALRLVGFAELAGSGLRVVQKVWRDENRRPPRFESSPSANTFTLVLDWRPLPENIDSFWKKRLGVKVTSDQANMLSLLQEPSGFSIEEISSIQGRRLDDVWIDIDYLDRQGLIDKSGKHFLLRKHLRDLVNETNRKESTILKKRK